MAANKSTDDRGEPMEFPYMNHSKTSLHKTLKHLIAFHGGPNTNVEQCVEDIEEAIVKAGWKAPVEKFLSTRLSTHGCLICAKCGKACPLCKTCKCHKPEGFLVS